MRLYNTFKVLKFNFLIICFLVLSTIGEASAATYYISANGSDSNNGTSQSSPWATFAYAMGQLSANDTLYLMDGTYTKRNAGMLIVTVSGTNGNPITFKALNDGQAIVDGRDSAKPCLVSGQNDITIEGIRFENSNANVVAVSGGSIRIIFRRCSAKDANLTKKVWQVLTEISFLSIVLRMLHLRIVLLMAQG